MRKKAEPPRPEPTELGRLITEWREKREISQNALARAADLSSPMISYLERGLRGKNPSRDTVLRLADALRAPKADFLAAAGYEVTFAEGRPSFDSFVNADPFLRSDQKKALLETYRTMVRESRR